MTGHRLAPFFDRLSGRVAQLAPASPSLRRLLHRARTRLPSERYQDALNLVLLDFARARPRANFVQVGAHDGREQDPLWRHIQGRKWSGVMVEPVPYVFRRLERSYANDPRIRLVNAAIAPTAGTATLYHLPESAEPGLPPWYDALASFSRDVIAKHKEFIPDIESRIEPIEVPTITFADLCRQNGIDRIDVVQIDTEGYDYEIIKLIDLDRAAPTILMYEHIHLSPEDRSGCESLLMDHGYEIYSDVMNTMGLHIPSLGKADSNLLQTWRRLGPRGKGRVGVAQ